MFDFDGVIVDTERLHLLAYQDILAPKGITMSAADYFERYLGYDDVGVFKAIGKDQDLPMDDGRVTALIAEKGRRYEELSAAGEMLFPGAADFIRAAAARRADRDRVGLSHLRDRRDPRTHRPAPAVYGHRRRRSNRAQQTESRSLRDGVCAPSRGDRPRAHPLADGGDRRHEVGARLGAWRRPALRRRHQHLLGTRAARRRGAGGAGPARAHARRAGRALCRLHPTTSKSAWRGPD